jgi:hypothetical protein
VVATPSEDRLAAPLRQILSRASTNTAKKPSVSAAHAAAATSRIAAVLMARHSPASRWFLRLKAPPSPFSWARRTSQEKGAEPAGTQGGGRVTRGGMESGLIDAEGLAALVHDATLSKLG